MFVIAYLPELDFTNPILCRTFIIIYRKRPILVFSGRYGLYYSSKEEKYRNN